MAGVPILIAGACLLAVAALVTWLARAWPPRTIPAGAAEVPAAAARRTANGRGAGVVMGMVAGGAAAYWGALGRGLLLAGPAFGLCVLVGVVAGEISVRPKGGQTRTAVVEVRQVRDYLPRGLAAAVLGATAALAGLVAVTTATAAADDLGRPGRALMLSCRPGLLQIMGPWPGSFYSAPLAALVIAGLIAAGAALRAVIGRARTGADPDAVAADDAVRRRAAWTITGACGILVTLPLAGISAVSAGAMLSASCRPVWWTYAAWALVTLLIPTLALMGWCATVLLAPARSVTAARAAR